MNDFLLYSIIGSVVLTIVLNVLALLFPNGVAKMQRRIEEHAHRPINQHEDDTPPRVKVLFPWKAMLIGSIVITVLVNLIRSFSQA